jgi:transcriptional regulator with XRE-family HTH domain
MKIGERIKRRRQELEWSQRDLAAKMNYSHHSTLARIESGQVDVTQSRIVQFSEVLGVSIAYLMGWEEDETKNDILSDIIVDLRTDSELLDIVDGLRKLDAEKRAAIKSLISAFSTDK